MKRKATRVGRLIIAQTVFWIASSEQRYKQTGRYTTDQEIEQARRGIARLNRARAHAAQRQAASIVAGHANQG